jgi:flagellar basal-body rod modification protein FlgD
MPAIPNYSSGTPEINDLSKVKESKSTMDKDGFLKLFVAQLTHQDPGAPMDTADSMNQMASFSMVEQITNMAAQNTKIADSLATSSAVGLIGRTVTYVDAAGVEQTGTVERVATSTTPPSG